MLGFTQPNNDIIVFFENDDLARLENEKVRGVYFNPGDPKKAGLLESEVNDKIDDRVKTSINLDENGCLTKLSLEMRIREYKIIVEKGYHEIHEGYRHISLIDVSRTGTLDFSNRTNYMQLKHWQSQNFS